jgi:Predicted transcriptional regulators
MADDLTVPRLNIDLKVDPEIASLFPELDDNTYLAIKNSIQQKGQQQPIIAAEDGTIVCGYVRYRITQELGIEPIVKVKPFATKQEMIDYALADNLERRNLNTYQKALVAIKLWEFEEKEAKNRQGKRTDILPDTLVKDFTQVAGRADEKAAKKVGISHVTMRHVQRIEQNCTEEIKHKCRTDQMTIAEAYKLAFDKTIISLRETGTFRISQTKCFKPIRVDNHNIVCFRIPDYWPAVKVKITPLERLPQIIEADETQQNELKGILGIYNRSQNYANGIEVRDGVIKVQFAKKTVAETALGILSASINTKMESIELLRRKKPSCDFSSADGHTLTFALPTKLQSIRSKFEEAVLEAIRDNYPMMFMKDEAIVSSTVSPSSITAFERELALRILAKIKDGKTLEGATAEVFDEDMREELDYQAQCDVEVDRIEQQKRIEEESDRKLMLQNARYIRRRHHRRA